MPMIPNLSPEQYAVVLRDLEEVLGFQSGSVTDPEVGLSLGARYFAVVARRPAPGAEKLAAALAERLREVLDYDEFTITANGEMLGVAGSGGSLSGIVGFALRLPLSSDERLGLALRTWGRDVGEFVSEVRGSEWPASRAEACVSVDPGVARLWCGATVVGRSRA